MRGIVTGGLGCEDGGRGEDMGEVGTGDRGGVVWGRSVKPSMKGGVDIEAALSQEGWAVRAVEEGKTWEKLARAIVRRISEGEQWVYRVGWERNSQKACM